MTVSTPVIPAQLPVRPDHVTPFETGWPVRLADTNRDRRLRLDATARYLQDMAFENLAIAPEADTHRAWVVRRTVFDVIAPIEFGESVQMKRWCSALSSRWTNMRIQVRGSAGGVIETESFIIHFSEETGLPARMTDTFMEPLLKMTNEHRLRWKAALPATHSAADRVREFPIRVADVDWLGHVNNTVHLQALEEVLADHEDLVHGSYRAIIEYAKPLMLGEPVELHEVRTGDQLDVWMVVDGQTRASGRVTPLGA
ncbi:acyl-[acyl-carrier-protein] thioesterase [Skermania sp. ID1734]|uniref:acyl-[acyl-carrier-protein] thioesterase n=1 Tax=Skermania sp. ID1734 TaxID=2597516 RepID=UPI00117CBF62|nr:acyl-ACP thioesterase domain-containing protein [Skermania sp. ID1734]TSE00443.1 acyl-[acyl-carrier-protein] thioesterase [Skermania sp. ID1734]